MKENLEYTLLTDKNHFMGNSNLYIVRKDDVYKYEIYDNKDSYKLGSLCYLYFNEKARRHLAFSTKESCDKYLSKIAKVSAFNKGENLCN